MKHYFTPNINIDDNILPIERFMKFEEDTYDVLGSVFLEKVQDAASQMSEVTVFEHECRFDVLAHKYMMDTNYWWVLMEYNNFIDWDLRGNDVLKIPEPTDLLMFEQELMLRYNSEQMDQ